MHRTTHVYCSAAACLLAFAAQVAVAEGKPAAATATAAAAPSPSYSAGVQIGESMHRAGLSTELDLADFMRGVKDALGGKASTPEDRERLNQFMAEVHKNILDRNHEAARSFLSKNGAAKGVVTTASGLQYRIIEGGDESGASPGPTDKVVVNYRGRLLDGTEFDSSYARGTPATFQLNGVIKGWQEALALMKPGAKWQLFIPPELAYDANSRPPIPPGSLLLFDVELISVGAPKE